jgi:putative selenate reductase molybdopterin-binding subunit
MGIRSVRNSDDGYGFAGSDTVILDGVTANASLLVAGQLDGRDVKTVESLSPGKTLSAVQSAMVDAGIVQSGYNAPAAALIMTDLLNRRENPSREDVIDAFSGLFNRATGYQQFFLAVEIARERMKDPDFVPPEIAPEFREDLVHIGTPRPKVDGPKLVSGCPAFVEDMVRPGSLILKMLRSPHAHAVITSINTAAAEALQGVELVMTHLNTPDIWYSQAGQGFPEPSPYDRRLFGKKVLHVGDRVAAVVAASEEIADKALGLIEVEYDVLPHVMSLAEAAAEDAPIIHKAELTYEAGAPDDLDKTNKNADPVAGRIIYQFPIGAAPHRNIAASVSGGIGNVEEGFKDADVIIERTYASKQIQCTPLETHTVYTRMDGERLVIHASTQVPWHLRRITARVLGIPENKIRVIKERVGGGYGSKQDILLEEVCAWATWQTGKPVFFRFSREDEFLANSTRHVMEITVKIGAKNDGKFTAVKMDVNANTGPYGAHCLTVPMNGVGKSLPLFLCDNFDFNVTTYYSNIPPTGAYQGYGAPKGSYAMQMAVAELAAELSMDPLDLIELNRVHQGSMLEILRCLGEGREGTAVPAVSCGLGPALKEGAEMIDWGKKESSANPDVKIGKGVVIIQQGSGLPGLDHSGASIKMLGDGTFMLHSGGADLGTGLDTVSVKMAAEVLCVDMDKVAIISGDTDITPFDTGAYASSGTYFSGSASKKAAEDIRAKILNAAAEILGEPEEDLVIEAPGIVRGKKESLTYGKLAWHTQGGEGSGQLIGTASFTTEDAAFPYGAHFCQVAVNTRTGKVKVQKYYALQDCGTPINPELAMGQIYGGVLKSIGHSMYEEMIFDKKGRCINTDLRSYGVPMIGDLPEDFQVKLVYTDDPFGPYGAKSVSEVSVNGAAPVIANAIHDAVGIWIREWPFSPEAVLKGLGKI